MILYACSSNPGKLREFAEVARAGMAGDVTIASLPLIQAISPPEETGSTFAENAVLKALYYSQFTTEMVFADDSGLAVDSLHGAPGVYSARYAGLRATDAENNALLLSNLQGKLDRSARFICVIACAKAGQLRGTSSGEVQGEILKEPRGTQGFGYDPLFYYPPLQASFGELAPEAKLAVSHRGKAMRLLLHTQDVAP